MEASAYDIKRFFSASNKVSKGYKDLIPTEIPLEVFLYSHLEEDYKRFTVFMRTPSNDFDLVAGFLFNEQIITCKEDIKKIFYCKKVAPEMYGNTIRVILSPTIDTATLLENKRNFIGSSSCGICGNLLFEHLNIKPDLENKQLNITKELIFKLPEFSSKKQIAFNYTGGIHSSTLFTITGDFVVVKEDIGRHNALDKIIGSMLLNNNIKSLQQFILLLSGRVSYELVQKAAVANIPIICALGAPSTLAVDLAKKFNITLIAFLNDTKFNIYNTSSRVNILLPKKL